MSEKKKNLVEILQEAIEYISEHGARALRRRDVHESKKAADLVGELSAASEELESVFACARRLDPPE